MADDKLVGTRPTSPPPKPPGNRKSGIDDKGNKNDKKKSGGGSSGADLARAAEKRAIARENAAKKKAGKRYLESAKNLEAQAKALRHALKTDFASSRDQNLRDLGLILGQQIGLLKEGHALRSEQFLKSAADTEKATAGTSEAGISNAVRERADSMSALLEQGAGETDTLKTLVMAARNWSANQGEVNRAYFDSMRSVNQGIVDLNIDTKSALANATVQNESERERIWQDFYNRRSESFTQLGNIKGQQRDYYAQAKEMGVKPKKGLEKSAKKTSEQAFMDAAKEAGKSYVNRGLPEWVQKFEGQREVAARQSNSNLAAAVTIEPLEKAEGATLRKWAA